MKRAFIIRYSEIVAFFCLTLQNLFIISVWNEKDIIYNIGNVSAVLMSV